MALHFGLGQASIRSAMVRWPNGVIEHVPTVRWLKVLAAKVEFLDFEESDRLLEAAKANYPEYFAMVLLALRTGLRQGELLALQWGDVDLEIGKLVVRRSRWRGFEGSPKNGRTRELPLSPETVTVLKAHRHLRGDYVFCQEDGSPLDENKCRRPLYTCCHRAGIARRHHAHRTKTSETVRPVSGGTP